MKLAIIIALLFIGHGVLIYLYIDVLCRETYRKSFWQTIKDAYNL